MIFNTQKLRAENTYGHAKKVSLIRKTILKIIGDRKKIKILDIGCGSGVAVSQYLSSSKISYTGVDLHKESVDYAIKNFSDSNTKFLNQSAESLESLDIKFDIIILSDILEHVDKPNQLLSNAYRLLNQKGTLIVSIPNGKGPFEIESSISKKPFFGKFSLRIIDLFIALLNKTILKDFWLCEDNNIPYNESSPHIHFFTLKNFQELASNNNFKIKNSYKLSFISGPYSNYFISPFSTLKKINCAIADYLPFFLVSAWLFELQKGDK